MFVISVIPLSRATTLESLSYYSSIDYPAGTILQVPVRKKTLSGIVTSSEPVSAAKTALRAATFSLKKLAPQEDAPALPLQLLETAKRIMDVVPAQLGSILFALLPPDIRTGQRPYPFTKTYQNNEDEFLGVLTETRENRYIAYKSLIRQAFAHRGSVLFVVPTSVAVQQAKDQLEQGIEKRLVTFSSTHNRKQIDASYESFVDFSNAKLIITTPNFALLDRHDITTIIVDESGSPHYKTRTRPYLDARDILSVYAKITKRTLLFGDILPRTEEEAWRREEIYQTHEEHPHRLNFTNTFTIAEHDNKNQTERESFIFTDELKSTIERTLTNKGTVFLLAARRGMAPLVTCYDCGYVFRCPDSGAPYTLFATEKDGQEERWFYSSTSGKKIRALDTCPHCNSWRLRQQGIGIQQVVRDARKLFPDYQIFTFDHTTATTYRKAKLVVDQFYKSRASILVGTSMTLPYLRNPIALTSVISYEAMRSVPTWRAEETVLGTLLKLREITSNELVVQTRTETDPLLKYATRGLVDDFYTDEIGMRQVLSYPPFSVFILFTWQGQKEQIKVVEDMLITSLPAYDIQFYNSPLNTEKITRHGLLRISHHDWPDKKLMETLRNLPPSIKIEVSPDKII